MADRKVYLFTNKHVYVTICVVKSKENCYEK